MKLSLFTSLKEKLNQHLVLTSVFSAMLLVAGSWILFARPALERADEQAAYTIVLEQRLMVLRKFAQQSDYIGYENSLRQKLKQAESNFVSKDQLNDVAGKLRQLAERQQLKVVSLRLPERTGIKPECCLPVETYDIQLSLQGDYYSLVNFVRQTENQYRVTGMSIEGKQDGLIKAYMELEFPGPV